MFSVVLLGVCDAHYKGTHVICGFAWCLWCTLQGHTCSLWFCLVFVMHITRAHTLSVVLLGVCDVITRAHTLSVVLLGVCGAHYKGTHVLCGFAWCL